MKKTIKILLLVLACVSFSLTVFADESPSRYVDCTVTNPNGAALYYDAGNGNEIETATIPYKTTVSVRAYYDIRNELPCPIFDKLIDSGIISENDRIGEVTYNDIRGYINVSDVTVEESGFSLNDAVKTENPQTYIITCEKGIPMFTGPSPLYEITGQIPDGTEITLTYTDRGEENNSADTFYYTEYNGQGGWIFKNPGYSIQCFDLLRKLDSNNPYTGKLKVTGNNLRLFDVFSPETDENGNFTGYQKVGGVIPAGTELTFDSYYEYDNWALTEYNGVKGCVAMYAYPGEEDEIGVIVYTNDEQLTSSAEMNSVEITYAAGAADNSASADVIEKTADPSKTIIICFVAAAVVIVIATGVSLIIIRKKKTQ